jgi:hypothetical protein
MNEWKAIAIIGVWLACAIIVIGVALAYRGEGELNVGGLIVGAVIVTLFILLQK